MPLLLVRAGAEACSELANSGFQKSCRRKSSAGLPHRKSDAMRFARIYTNPHADLHAK
jgi:hypothetical protein